MTIGKKLGRNRPLARGPRLKFANFLKVTAPPPPPKVGNWIHDADAPVYGPTENILGNDKYGDCTCAGVGHIIDILRANQGIPNYRAATTADALAFYARVTDPPFNPKTGDNDNGADEVTVLNVWQQHGFFPDGTGKIAAYASVNARNILEVKQAIHLFGNVYLGAGLPDRWLNPEPDKPGFVWDVAGNPNENNGHCIIGYGYNDHGVFVDSWGMYGTVTWPAMAAYFTEAAGGDTFTVLSEDWVGSVTKTAPNSLDMGTLEEYISFLFN